MIADPVQPRTRRILALTAMSCVAVIVLIADAVSKAQVLARLPGHPPVRLLHGLVTLDLTFNAGAAFGVGTSYTAIIAVIVLGVIAYIIRSARRLRSLAWTIALGLLLGGAMGNLGDRLFREPGLLRGQVVDWINLPNFPWTFNLADASITCAAVLIAVLALRGTRIDGTSPAHAADRPGAPAQAADRPGAPAQAADRPGAPARAADRPGAPAHAADRPGAPASALEPTPAPADTPVPGPHQSRQPR
jgi:signal peptidase II